MSDQPSSRTRRLAKMGITWSQGNPLPDESTMPIVHLFRAEVTRETVWRQRLDTTTNWAILTCTALIGVAYGSPEVPHPLLLLAMLLVLLLLMIEGRRYRHYDVWRARSRLLESHFFAALLLPEFRLPQGDWRKRLADDLIQPAYHMGRLEAVAMRLKRNYLWLFMMLVAAWVGKVFYHTPEIATFSDFFQALRTGPIPAGFYLTFVSVFGIAILVVLLYGLPRNERGAAIQKRIVRQTDWPV